MMLTQGKVFLAEVASQKLKGLNLRYGLTTTMSQRGISLGMKPGGLPTSLGAHVRPSASAWQGWVHTAHWGDEAALFRHVASIT